MNLSLSDKSLNTQEKSNVLIYITVEIAKEVWLIIHRYYQIHMIEKYDAYYINTTFKMNVLIMIKDKQVKMIRINQEEISTQEDNSECTNSEQQVTRNNVFDYAIATVNEVGYVDLMKFQEPAYSDGVWTIVANNKFGSGSNAVKEYDDRQVQIYDGSREIAHETKIKL